MDYKRVVRNKMTNLGETDFGKRTITVNKKKSRTEKGGIIDTIVHEEMHARHPKMHERTVRKKTPAKVRKMSKNAKTKLYAKFKTKKGRAKK